MPRPDLKAFGMETFLAYLAGRIALPVHILVANRAHGVLLKRRKVLGLLVGGRARYSFVLMFLGRLSSLLCVFELDKAFQFRIEVGG